MINRPDYEQQLKTWKDKDVIKVVTGIRRCGKSTLLQLFAQNLISQGIDKSRIITINLEQLENEQLLDYKTLHDEILSRVTSEEMHYVMIDEVQNVTDFQKAVDSLYTRPNIDLYITGSNALLLEGTLTTLLSGRYVEIKIQPFSFKEYKEALDDNSQQNTTSLMRLYNRYCSQGGFPVVTQLENNSLIHHDYLEGILNTVLLKDVAQRYKITNLYALEVLVQYLFDNIGNLTSIKKIADTMTSFGTKISTNTVAGYLKGLCNSYIFYPARRYDIKGKKLLKMQAKYYGVDMGLRKIVLSNQVRDTGRILENIVFFELKRRYGTVWVGSVGDQEIDFIVTTPQGVEYFQVAETIQEEATKQRELASLKKIPDNNPKTILTLDDCDPIYVDGIKIMNTLDFFME